jgi:hypothetical protein
MTLYRLPKLVSQGITTAIAMSVRRGLDLRLPHLVQVVDDL